MKRETGNVKREAGEENPGCGWGRKSRAVCLFCAVNPQLLKKALFAYLLAVTRSALPGLAIWCLFGVLRQWPVDTIRLVAMGGVVTVAIVFSPYLLFGVAGYRLRQVLYFVPILLLCGLRGYNLYLLSTGQQAEMLFAASRIPVQLWHAYAAECLVAAGVCFSIYRRHKTFYDTDPVEDLLR